jgi:predicted transposase YbfD/YdcC
LHEDVRLLLDDPERAGTPTAQTVDGDHGRIESRTATVSTDIEWVHKTHQWPGLAAIGKVVRVRETPAKTTPQTAYYLLSTKLSAERFNDVARQHWGIENQLHWRLDVTMNEDQSTTKADNGPQNLARLRHMAINIMQKDQKKESLRGKFQRAGWDNAYLTHLLTLFRNAIALGSGQIPSRHNGSEMARKAKLPDCSSLHPDLLSPPRSH